MGLVDPCSPLLSERLQRMAVVHDSQGPCRSSIRLVVRWTPDRPLGRHAPHQTSLRLVIGPRHGRMSAPTSDLGWRTTREMWQAALVVRSDIIAWEFPDLARCSSSSVHARSSDCLSLLHFPCPLVLCASPSASPGRHGLQQHEVLAPRRRRRHGSLRRPGTDVHFLQPDSQMCVGCSCARVPASSLTLSV